MAEPEPGPASVRIQRRIEWSDTDASGAYHNSAAFDFMESAEVTLVDRLGIREDVYGRHPRVRIEADFLAPLWFRDLVDVEIHVVRVGRTSVTYDAEIRRDGELCVRGRLVAVLLDRIGGTPQPWPDEYRRLFETAGRQVPERLVTGD
jgi:YbgC/YbaW family acyl-CoA thioester hydrolase